MTFLIESVIAVLQLDYCLSIPTLVIILIMLSEGEVKVNQFNVQQGTLNYVVSHK